MAAFDSNCRFRKTCFQTFSLGLTMLINSWLTIVKNSLQKSNTRRAVSSSRKGTRSAVNSQPAAEMLETRVLLSATSFDEHFSAGTLPGNLERSGVGLTAAPVNGSFGGSIFENGYVRFTGQDTRGDASGGLRTFLRTVDDDYSSVDFVAEVTVTIVPNSGSPNLGRNIAFFGLGTAESGAFGEPDSAGIRLNVLPTNFISGLSAVDGGSNGGSVPAPAGGDGTYRLRMEWSACDETATFKIDKNYAGGAFVADYTLGAIDGSNNGFSATNARLFIGGDWNTRFDDFSVVVSEPACDSSTLSIGNASVTEGNSGTTVLSFPVTLSNPVDVAVSVDYATQNGTATAGSDYLAQSGTLTITSGSTTGTINITVNGDSAIELNETLSVVLSNVQASGRDVKLAGDSAVIVSSASNGSQSFFDGNISNVDLINQGSATLGSAVFSAGGNFSAYGTINGTASSNGSGSGLSYWSSASGGVNLTYTLAGSASGYDISSINTIYGWNDAAQRHAAQRYSVYYTTVSNSTFTLLQTVVYDPFADPASGNGPQGSSQVTLTDNSGVLIHGTTAIRFHLDSDNGVEVGVVRELDVFGQVASPPVPLGGVGTIVRDDSATVLIGNTSVAEGNSGTTVLSFPVTLSNPIDVAVSVDYTTQNGTAIAGSDYSAQSGTLTIPAGSTTGTIDITVDGDTAIELNETLSVILGNVQASGRDVALGVDVLTPGVVQLDASTLGLASGTVVSSWSGQTSAGTPTLLTGQTPNGGAAVQFNAGGDRLGDNVFVPASAAGDFIYVAVVKANNIGAYHNLVDDDAQNRPMLWIDGSFNYELNFSGGGGAKAAGTGPGGWDIVIMDSRLNQLYVNSATPNASGGGAVSFTAGETFDFFHRDGGQTFNGLVAEARIYNDRAAFGGDFAALYNELQTKWFGSGLGSSVGVGTIVNDDYNTAPTANAGGPYTVAEGSSIVLNASGSLDAEQSTASLGYAWDLDGDGLFGETGGAALRGNEVGIAPTFSATALNESVVTVELKVMDNAGAVSQLATAQITVANVAPTVTVRNVTMTVDEGQVATNGGSFGDTGLDSPSISASIGNVTQTGGGSITYAGSIGGLGTPIEMAFDTAGNLFVAEDTPGRVAKYSPSGTLVTRWSVGGATTGLAVDSVGNVYVTSKALHNIQVYTNSGTFIRTIGGFGSGNGQFHEPHAITLDAAGNIYVTENGNSRVQVLDNTGNFLRKWGTLGYGQWAVQLPARDRT
jgi:hypothetical protein